MKRKIGYLTLFLIGCLGIFVLLAYITNVPTKITPDDKIAFELLGFDKDKFQKPKNFDEEIRQIRYFQNLVFTKIQLSDGIPEGEDREPMDLVRRQRGLCYDRSRMIDKGLKNMGFETRHVYILFPKGKSFLSAIMTYRQDSHAVTEVKTSKGWMLVGSNEAWISLDQDGKPLSADHLWQKNTLSKKPSWYEEPYYAIRGLYSRKGQFYAPRLPFPELNWKDFASWILFEVWDEAWQGFPAIRSWAEQKIHEAKASSVQQQIGIDHWSLFNQPIAMSMIVNDA